MTPIDPNQKLTFHEYQQIKYWRPLKSLLHNGNIYYIAKPGQLQYNFNESLFDLC
jgi:hypothetical protein